MDMETKIKSKEGNCRFCKQTTDLMCGRCGDFYCSEKCQSTDWPNHRSICFPIPKLVPINESNVLSEHPPGTTDNFVILPMAEELNATIKVIFHKVEKIYGKRCMERTNANETRIDVSKTVLKTGARLTQEEQDDSDSSQTTMCTVLNNDKRIPSITEKIEDSISPNKPLSKMDACDQNRVIICTFRSTNRVYIRKKTDIKLSALRERWAQIDEYGRSDEALPLQDLPKVGTFAVTKKSSGEYVRVEILEVHSEKKIRVLVCDSGNVFHRNLEDLRQISDCIANLPKNVVLVQLHNVSVYKFTNEILEYLKSLEHKECRMETINTKVNAQVKLYDIENGQLLNDLITNFCSINSSSLRNNNQRNELPQDEKNAVEDQSTPTKLETTLDSDDEKKSFMVTDSAPFKTHLFTISMRKFRVVVVDVTLIKYGYMACVREEHISYISDIQKTLNNIDFDEKPYKPKLKEYCVVRIENEWFRGLVINLEDDGKNYEISLIDFLTEITLPSAYIRPYPKSFKMDCYTTLCKLHNLPKNFTQKHKQLLKSKIAINDFLFIESVIEIIEENIALVECSIAAEILSELS